MHALNHVLDRKVLDADGRYLDTQGLKPLELYFQTYASRLEAYQHLRDKSKDLVTQALKKLSQTHPELIQKHGPRCQYDMSEVLRYTALSILRDDETFFKEQMISWLDTILLAHKKHAHCATAYRYLQDAINNSLPASTSSIVRPYMESVILTLQSHA
jgi:Phycobilisome protein